MSLMISTKSFQGDAGTAARARQMLVLANRVLANQGVVDAYGHVSIRNPENPDTFFISRPCPRNSSPRPTFWSWIWRGRSSPPAPL